jgi:toxin ParE1/3/4
MVDKEGCLVRLEWAESTETDLNRIIAHYAEIAPSIAMQLVERIENAPKPLLDFPFIGPETEVEGLRKWRVVKTPFLLLYTVEPDLVTIIRVVDARSNWQGEDA